MRAMRKLTEKIILFIILCCLPMSAAAQLRGYVVDHQTGDSIALATIAYHGLQLAVKADEQGRFQIERRNGQQLVVSAVGYKPKTIRITDKTTDILQVRLLSEAKRLKEVVVKSKRKNKYTRKNNPAVELMQRVIAAKRRTDLSNHDFYRYEKYQKLTMAVNNLTPEELEGKLFKKMPWLHEQVELCPHNQKLILPISVDETITEHLYRKSPNKERTIVKGETTQGISTLLQTGEAVNTIAKDLFTDIDLYDDHIRFLSKQFPSPIGSTAISFYRFYIDDTVHVDQDECIRLQFMPSNPQDFGFRGELYILNDSTLHVKKCDMQLPSNTGVNFVSSIKLNQTYDRLDNGEWVLSKDNMVAELEVTDLFQRAIAIRTTHLSGYSFEPIENQDFRGSSPIIYDPNAKQRDADFWTQHRKSSLTNSEGNMKNFISGMRRAKNFGWLLFLTKSLIENFVETSFSEKPSKFDIGPVNTLISHNFIDAFRFRVGGRTTAKLHPHLFWEGYYAYGSRSKKNYYSTKFTYSFSQPAYQPVEFPSRYVSFESSYDVMSPADKFLIHNKDNAFMAFRAQKVKQMYFYNRQRLNLKWEWDMGLATSFELKTESNQPTGELDFVKMNGRWVDKIRTTELTLGIDYRPGQTYVNSKQNRIEVNHDAPRFSLSHTLGIKGLLGSDYHYNYTELSAYKRLWLGSWGYVNGQVKLGAQWNKVPFPLLIIPPANLSFFDHENTFSLMNNMEFLSDRHAFACVGWNMNGKLFNRIPLIRKLKWREYIAIRGMWSHLTDKNNPLLERNKKDPDLFQFPQGVHVMSPKEPYWEVIVGIHNIFKLFEIDYVRRLSYTGLPTSTKHGIRFGFAMTF
ncbi:MAG: carboxypeptidase-like regulatory domain-containing protein [Prevotella sp.]|nr:carboxypeptidase-like regulatory domain-containing protein [Prevotella sp.]